MRGCTPVTTRRETLRGCADVGCDCKPRVESPLLGDAPRAQHVLDAAWNEFVLDGTCWLCSADYVVHYDANDILSVTFRTSGYGAYPDTHIKPITLQVSSGRVLTAGSVFLGSAMNRLASRVDQLVQKAIANAPAFRREVDTSVGAGNFGVKQLDQFVVTERGLLFYFDFGLGHAVQAVTPSSEYLLSFEEARPFLDPNGPLGWATNGTEPGR